MAGKLIELNAAAEMLGVSPEQLVEMRQRGEIHGFRDGSSWKFKPAEIDRVKEELEAGRPLTGDSDDLSAEAQESILVTEEPRVTGESGTSTIIGADKGQSAEDSDIRLSEGSDIHLAPETVAPVGGSDASVGSDIAPGSDLDLDVSADDLDASSDLKLSGDSDIDLTSESGIGTGSGSGGSDVSLMADPSGSDVRLVAGDSDGADSDPALGADSDVLGMDSDVIGGGSSGEHATGDTDRLTDSDLELADEPLAMATGDSLALGDDEMIDEGDSVATGSGAGSGIGSGVGSDVALSALDEEDEDLVLSPSGIGSDLTLDAGDSGIGLSTPGDSGISLEEEPLDLGGSGIDSLELPEDDDDAIVELDEEADPEAATQLKADDDFLLEPVDMDDEDDESGSQVIALEDSAYADAEAATMLGTAGESEAALVAEEMGASPGAMQPQMMPMQPAAQAAGRPEAPYSIWNLLGLAIVLFLMVAMGVLAADLMRNMWQHGGDAAGSASLADFILGYNE